MPYTNKIDLTIDLFDEDLTGGIESILEDAATDIRNLLKDAGENEATVTIVDFAGPAVRHF